MEKNKPPFGNDKCLLRDVVFVLGGIAFCSMTFGFCLILEGKDIPDLFITLGSAAAGALAGIIGGRSF